MFPLLPLASCALTPLGTPCLSLPPHPLQNPQGLPSLTQQMKLCIEPFLPSVLTEENVSGDIPSPSRMELASAPGSLWQPPSLFSFRSRAHSPPSSFRTGWAELLVPPVGSLRTQGSSRQEVEPQPRFLGSKSDVWKGRSDEAALATLCQRACPWKQS